MTGVAAKILSIVMEGVAMVSKLDDCVPIWAQSNAEKADELWWLKVKWGKLFGVGGVKERLANQLQVPNDVGANNSLQAMAANAQFRKMMNTPTKNPIHTTADELQKLILR